MGGQLACSLTTGPERSTGVLADENRDRCTQTLLPCCYLQSHLHTSWPNTELHTSLTCVEQPVMMSSAHLHSSTGWEVCPLGFWVDRNINMFWLQTGLALGTCWAFYMCLLKEAIRSVRVTVLQCPVGSLGSSTAPP